MISSITSFFTKKQQTTKSSSAGASASSTSTNTSFNRRSGAEKQVFSKAFRWRMPEGQTEEPRSVEVVGSFNGWQRTELKRDAVLNSWQTTVHQIPGNRTHHYMLLVDGKPTIDQNCDGMATPYGFQEQEYQIETEKGPRVLMLFSQTK